MYVNMIWYGGKNGIRCGIFAKDNGYEVVQANTDASSGRKD